LATANGNGSAVVKDDVVLTESGSYGASELARVESNQSVLAISNFSEGDTRGHSMLSFSTDARIQMDGSEGVRWVGVANAAHSHGFANSKTGGNVSSSGVVIASVKTETAGLLSESVSLSSTFGGGASLNDSANVAFIGEIATVNASGGDSSHSQGTSSLSIKQSVPGSYREQSVVSTSSSGEDFSYSVHLMQFGDIVGTASGSVTLTSGSSDVTRIQSSGNSKGSNFYGWESRSAVISSSESFFVHGYFNDLNGSNGGWGDLDDGFNGSLVWSISSGTSIVGTINRGTMFQYGTEGSTVSRASNFFGPLGYTNRPTPQNVGMFAFLAPVFPVFRHTLASQTLPFLTPIRRPARILWGDFLHLLAPTLGTLQLARPAGYKMYSSKYDIRLPRSDSNPSRRMPSRLACLACAFHFLAALVVLDVNQRIERLRMSSL
jgi:hypothetical protein